MKKTNEAASTKRALKKASSFEGLLLPSVKEILIRSAGGCFPVADYEVNVISNVLAKCLEDLVFDAQKFSMKRQLNDEISFEDILLALRKDQLTLSRVLAKLTALDGRDTISTQTDSDKLPSTSKSAAPATRLQKAETVLGSLQPEVFVSTTNSGLLYGRLLRSSATREKYYSGSIDDDSSKASKSNSMNFGADVKGSCFSKWLLSLTAGLPVGDSAVEVLGFCAFEYLQQIADIAALQLTSIPRPALSSSSTLRYSRCNSNILVESSRRFLESRRRNGRQ